jgi:hypothetical protein
LQNDGHVVLRQALVCSEMRESRVPQRSIAVLRGGPLRRPPGQVSTPAILAAWCAVCVWLRPPIAMVAGRGSAAMA